jgi:hypothetical protein
MGVESLKYSSLYSNAPPPSRGKVGMGVELLKWGDKYLEISPPAAHRARACKPWPFSRLGVYASKALLHPQPSPW